MVLVGLSFYIGETNMEIKQKIDILGTEYAVGIDDAACIAMNADGLCKYYDKEIILRKLEKAMRSYREHRRRNKPSAFT